MAELEGRCPHCGKNLKVPEDVERFLCMYCGEKLVPADIIIAEEDTKAPEKAEINELDEKLCKAYEAKSADLDMLIAKALDADAFDPIANEIFLKRHIAEIVLKYEDIMTSFSRSKYVPAFQNYSAECKFIVECADRVYTVWGEKGREKVKEAAEVLVDSIDERVENDPSLKMKRSKFNKKEDLKMVLAIWAIPMVQEQGFGVGDTLADFLVEAWCEKNPKNQIAKGRYPEIVVGFKKGKLCFITTAVCGSFGKPDDCYELESFRHFRDTYMSETPERRALAEEYYDIAPAIVTCIDMQPDAKDIYRNIWDRWLSPCMKNIEAGDQEACEASYEDMVLTLKKKYLS